MELRHLKHFIVLAEELHFARAASRLQITQPALSKQIQLLEQDLGFPLFYRTKQRVELLDAGHVLLDEARRILRQAENAVESAWRTHNGQSGRLLVGFHSSAMLEVLPKVLRKYRRLYPEVMVELWEMLGMTDPPVLYSAVRGAELVLDNPLSVALLRSPVLNEELFCIETILHEPFVVAVPNSHPAAKQDSVRIKSLADELFIIPHRQPGWDYSDAIFQLFRDNAIEPRIAHEAGQMLTIASLVAGGFGVAVVPASFSNLRFPGVTYRPIKGRSQTTDLAMVWKRDSRASTLRTFLEVVRAEYPKR